MSEKSESTERINELIMDQKKADNEKASEMSRWHRKVALSTLLLALLAALGGLLSGITAQESNQEKIEEIIDLTVLEGDRVSVEVLKAKHEILLSLGETPDAAEVVAIQTFEQEIKQKQAEITAEETLAQTFAQTHLIFAVAVTVLAVGISISGMSVVVEQRWLWVVGMAFGLAGSIGVALGIITMLI
jgi:hypothetical protein